MTQPGDGPVNGPPSPRSPRSPRRSWGRRHKFLTALLSALVVVLAVVITVTVSSGGGSTSASPVGSRAASAAEAAAVTKGAKWLTGPAGKVLLKAVLADLGRLSTAERAGRQGAAKIAGTQLATDAKAALNGPMPPEDAKVYQSALKDFETAGTYAASGDFSKAAPFLNAGEGDITKVTAAVNRPAAVNIKEPDGQ